MFNKLNPGYQQKYRGLEIPSPKLSKEFVDQFDVVMVVQIRTMKDNWDVLKHKPIILKTCGNTYNQEAELEKYARAGNIEFVRGSKNEFKMKDSNGGRVIRISCDPDLYSGWTGEDPTLLSFHSHFMARRKFPPVKEYLKIHPHFNTRLYGAFPKGYKDPLIIDTLSWKEQIDQFKKCAVYFMISSGRAPITYNFIEAFMMGIPVVTFGPKISSSVSVQMGFPALCEIPEIIKNEVDGFFSDDSEQLKKYVSSLMNDEELRKSISTNARKKALEMFSPENSAQDWKKLFIDMGFSL